MVLQPVVTAFIELTLWYAVFRTSGRTEIAGYGEADYLAYALWGAFVARITVSWMYEYRMTEEIDSGSVNGLLVRPLSYYEYYLSQFLGYKAVTTVVSLLVPITATYALGWPTELSRLPLTLVLLSLYLVLVHTISFCVATLAFRINKAYSITAAKNLGLWMLSGELFPLDMLPDFWREVLLWLPFSNAVYVPVAYLTGRAEIDLVARGFLTTGLGLLFFALLGAYLWRTGLRRYSGTGA